MSAKPQNPTDAPTDDELAAALAEARSVARYDDTPDDETEFMFPEAHYNTDTLTGSLVAFLSPSSVVAWTALREPDADEVDGAAPGDDAPRTARTLLFDAALDGGDEQGDEADLAFRVVATFENSYDDERVVVETPAPWDVPDEFDGDDPNEVVKSLSWDDHHYTFDDDDREAPPEASEAWTLDKSGAAPLREAAIENGYEWVVETDGEQADDEDEAEDALDRLTEFVREGDEVRVRYEKKNGNGVGTKAGVVWSVGTGEDGGTQGVVFERDDGKYNRVLRDDENVPGAFSSGHYPFMGTALSVEVEPTTDDE